MCFALKYFPLSKLSLLILPFPVSLICFIDCQLKRIAMDARNFLDGSSV